MAEQRRKSAGLSVSVAHLTAGTSLGPRQIGLWFGVRNLFDRLATRLQQTVLVLTIRRILVPVDFTETSDRALEYAVELARRFDAAITILHAYQIPAYGFPDTAIIASAELAAQISSAAQTRLNTLVDAHKTSGVNMTSILRDGVAWEEIQTVAEEVHADLIAIGTHGRRGLARALLGSVAENVIRTSNLPVLVIHGPRDTKDKERA